MSSGRGTGADQCHSVSAVRVHLVDETRDFEATVVAKQEVRGGYFVWLEEEEFGR